MRRQGIQWLQAAQKRPGQRPFAVSKIGLPQIVAHTLRLLHGKTKKIFALARASLLKIHEDLLTVLPPLGQRCKCSAHFGKSFGMSAELQCCHTQAQVIHFDKSKLQLLPAKEFGVCAASTWQCCVISRRANLSIYRLTSTLAQCRQAKYADGASKTNELILFWLQYYLLL